MQGNLFIITAASGAGKTSLVKALLEKDQHIKLSISHTTRAQRQGEDNGVHYHFVKEDCFLALLEAGDFIESALVHSARYGTSRSKVNAALAAGSDVVLEIDWQGAEQVKKLYPDAISIFILPPSLEALEERLSNRGQDSAEVIAERMAVADAEMRHVVAFDYVTINDKFDNALQDLIAIIQSQRLKTNSQLQRHSALLQKLI
ncbi:MAG: guanylate kinase [Methylophilaceae bacterium]|jgi:guanylate kinase|nr:guanylate kinase [Methylophilaceae bacterium]